MFTLERNHRFRLLSKGLRQLSVYLLKARPLLGVPPPAAQHELIVDSVGTTERLGQVHLAPRHETNSGLKLNKGL